MKQPNQQTKQTQATSRQLINKIRQNHREQDTNKIYDVVNRAKDAAVIYDKNVEEHRLVVRSPHTGQIQRENIDPRTIGLSTDVELRCAITGEQFKVSLQAVPKALEVKE